MSKPIYLDYAAATPVDPGVLSAMQLYFAKQFYNPSATYLAGQAVHSKLESLRSKLAQTLGIKAPEIVFTAGGTEANNLAIQGVMDTFPAANVVVSSIEHESVLVPAKKYSYKLAPVRSDGLIDVKELIGLIDSRTVLVSVMYANNEIGTIQPLKQIAAELAQIRRSRQHSGNKLPLYFHSDACQAANTLDMHAGRLGLDLMTINGGKAYGPKQSGALFIKTGTQLTAQLLGGGQERGLRSGTENVAFAAGLATAIVQAQAGRAAEQKRLLGLQARFVSRLSELPGVSINGSLNRRLSSNINANFSGQDNERLMMMLDEMGVQCAVGSACSASNDQPSHVLSAIGLSEVEAQQSLRFSMGKSTTAEQIDKVLEVLKVCLSDRQNEQDSN